MTRYRGVRTVLIIAGTIVALLVSALLRGRTSRFHADIAPILRDHCAECHREGGAAPFALVTFEDARKRATLIADVTRRRLMPPWMPDPGCAEFLGNRSLNEDDIDRLQSWVRGGAPEGEAPAIAPPPAPDPDPLGKPDLLVTLPEPYLLQAEGRDVYRNFVLPLPPGPDRFVRAVEFRPGNAKAVHHAFLFLDRTRESERLDRRDPEPGFPGLHVPPTAQAPPGHFLSWQPGRRSPPEPEDMAWTLPGGASIVVQAHLRPTGKREEVRPSVALYFTDKVPTRVPVKIGLWTEEIRIPAGGRTTVHDTLTLPADVDLLRILPHAHFLARRVEASAALPDGSTRCLLRISSWDFNWQGDYAYRHPVSLPKGATLSMEIEYDNTANNPRNPNQPPKEVRYGVESGDEMAEVWMQVLPRTPEGAGLLERAIQPKVLSSGVAFNRYLLRLDPGNTRARFQLGKALYLQGKSAEAAEELTASLRLAEAAEPHYFLGLIQRGAGRLDAAAQEFRDAIRLNPEDPKALGNLGLVLSERGDLDGAEAAFEAALRLDPGDEIARSCLVELRAARKKR